MVGSAIVAGNGVVLIEIPDGGAPGEVLTKITADDFDFDWVAPGGGGSTIIVEDEGVPVGVPADTLDFVGAGVIAAGAGTTKTITIAGIPIPASTLLDATLRADGAGGWVEETQIQILASGRLQTLVATGPAILDEASGNTNPTIIPNKNNLATGLGTDASDTLALIADGEYVIEIADDSMVVRGGKFAIFTGLLDMQSTVNPFLPPRLTTIQKNALANTEGSVVYDTDLDSLYQNDGAVWTVPGAGLTDLQTAYDNNPVGAQILLDAVPNPLSVQAAVIGDIFTVEDTVGATIFKVEDDGANGLVSTVKNLQTRHIGMGLSIPTEGHIIIGSEEFLTSPGTAVGIGIFPRFIPDTLGINNLYGMQGNVFFGDANWAAGSTVASLQFFPAPDYQSGSTSWGTAGTTFFGIQTGGCLNIFGRTIVGDQFIGVSATAFSHIFGAAGGMTANFFTGVHVATPSNPIGVVGVVTGIRIGDQDISAGTITQALWLESDSQNGGDIVFGLGKDAAIWYDGTDLNIDPQRVGTGSLNVVLRLDLLGTLQTPPISPAALGAGNNNDWIGLLTNTVNTAMRHWARISGNATTSVLTGISATQARDGDTFKLTNVSANAIDINHQDVASTAANRIISPTGANYVLGADESCEIIYDATTTRWRILYGSGA